MPLELGGEWHGRARDPPEFRRKVLDLVEAGRSVAEVARDLEISDQSIYTWRRQDRIDRGLQPGLTSGEKGELAKAKRRIGELETELRAMRRAMELVRAVVPPKEVRGGQGDGCRSDPSPGGLPGPGRVDLGLLRLTVPAAVGAGEPPCLARPTSSSRCIRPPWRLRRPSGARGAAPWSRHRGRPRRHRAADAPGWTRRRDRPAQHVGPS